MEAMTVAPDGFRCLVCDNLCELDDYEPFCSAVCQATYRRTPRLTRAGRLQGLADRGVDTWDDFRDER